MIKIYYKDGTQMCGLGEKISIEVPLEKFASLKINIVSSEEKLWPGFLPQYCGGWSGNGYVFVLDDNDWTLNNESLIEMGFLLWPTEEQLTRSGIIGAAVDSITPTLYQDRPGDHPFKVPEGGDHPFPLSGNLGEVPKSYPLMVNLNNIYGHRIRIVFEGDFITYERIPDRVTFVLNRVTKRVVDIWFG